jgi:N-acetylneuraminic acid mutarotase
MKKIAFYVMSTLGAFIVLALGSCQKEGANPSTAANAAAKANLTVGLPPILVAWTGMTGPSYSDGLAGDWVSENQYVRGFTINGIGFSLGTLITSGKWGLNYRCYDLWQCNPATRNWTRKSPYPGDPINLEFGASFVIGDNAYVISVDNHVYRYNQPGDSWAEVAAIPTSFVRINAGCFAINGLGYFGLGENYGPGTFLNDWYQYDPVANLWTKMHAFPGTKREGAAGFAVDGKGYIAGGRGSAGYGTSVLQYNSSTDSWTEMKNFPGTSNNIYMPATAAGTIGGVDVGFVAAAQAWQYNPAQDSWLRLTRYVAPVWSPGGFVIGNAFFVCGLNAEVYSWSR